MAQSVKQLARILFGVSVLFFGLSFGSALLLPVMGMYIALGLLFVASFSMLLASLLRERVKLRHANSSSQLRAGRLERGGRARPGSAN